MLNSEDYLNIFHEIKNSITLISSSLQLVEKKHPEVSDFAYWAETMSEITSLRNMVTELSSARLCDHLNLRHVNLYDYMEDIHDSISAFAALDFHCNIITEENLPEIDIDPQLLKQALINLLKNAMMELVLDVQIRRNLVQLILVLHAILTVEGLVGSDF